MVFQEVASERNHAAQLENCGESRELDILGQV